MRRWMAMGVLAAAVAGCNVGQAQTAAPQAAAVAAAKRAAQTDVPVKSVVLFSSGVGYFEHDGPVKGDASAELRFKTAQINDILKSLVLQDTGGGKVSTVIYPSQDPASRTLKSFQVDLTSNPPLADLLNQLRGAKVKIVAGPETLTGTILGLEKKPKAVKDTSIEVWQINLVQGGTIRSLAMDEVSRIELEDAQLQEELNKALLALAQSRDQDKKPVTIHFQGQGERMVRIGYVVETPVWKTSYRLLLGSGEQKSSLQGWAIVENQTDNDWNDVKLSLVSGRPISFIQELYQPLYVPRPVVYPELFASLKPQTYEAGIEKEAAKKEPSDNGAAESDSDMPGANGGPTRMGRAKGARTATATAAAPARPSLAQQIDKAIDINASVQSIALAQKAGELFEYKVGSVTLPRQQSAMIPIITDPIDVERVSIYNPTVLARNALNGARVKNTTGKHLLQGPVTVLDGGTYAGDARIDNVPPGQERLISFGIDLQLPVNASNNKSDVAIVTGKIVKGMLNVQRKNVFTQEYVAENKDDKDRTMVIEHPIRQGWKLVEPAQPLETTETLYRFQTKVPAGKSTTFTVKEEIVQSEAMAIVPMEVSSLEVYGQTAEIPAKVREALAKAAALKSAMADAQRQIDQRKLEINQITQDQNRIRENLKALPDKGELKTRSLEKLEEQEKRMDAIFQEIDQAQGKYDKAKKDLEDYLANLDVE